MVGGDRDWEEKLASRKEHSYSAVAVGSYSYCKKLCA